MILKELIKYKQWLFHDSRKRPVDGQGNVVSINDPTKFYSFVPISALLVAKMKLHGDQCPVKGIGFVFTDKDPFTGIDLDGCRNPKTGEIQEWAMEIVVQFESYTEVSPSGTGLHIICKGKAKKSLKTKHVEIYSKGRFFTVTMDPLFPVFPIRSCQKELDALVARFRP